MTIFQMFQHILASFLATKLIEKWLTVFRCFNRYWPFFWQLNPLQKNWPFFGNNVSPDFWHYSSDKTHWKNWLFSDVSTDIAIFMATNPIEEIDSVSDVSTDFGHFFWRQNPLTRSVPATRILVVKEVFGLFSRLQLRTFFSLR